MNTHRVWFITGASSGIGRELALSALRRGDKVAAISRSAADLPGALVLRADVRDEASVRAAVAAAVDAFGRIDVLANNAGYGLFGAVEESTDAQARAVFDTNVFGVLNVLRAVLPIMRRQGAPDTCSRARRSTARPRTRGSGCCPPPSTPSRA